MTRRASIVFALAVSLCACGAKTSYLKDAKKTLSVAYDVTKTADSTFAEWSKEHQAQIVAKASSREEAEKALADFRAKRQPVIKAFALAYTAIGSVAAALPLVEKGVKKEGELTPLLFDALKAANDVKAAIQTFQEATQ
jgi:hypothetical protein